MNRRGFLWFLISAPLTASLPWEKIADAVRSLAPSISRKIDFTVADIIAKTLAARHDELVANIIANNALLKRNINNDLYSGKALEQFEKLRD